MVIPEDDENESALLEETEIPTAPFSKIVKRDWQSFMGCVVNS